MDVISLNSGADWSDGQISPFILKTLHEITGKPVLVSEFYMCAEENRSGNKNPGAIFPTVRTQRERAAAFRSNLQSLAELPYVVGAHWFQYTDEPTYGRPDGENYNMGLVDIEDRPYEELVSAAASLDTNAIHGEKRKAAASGDRLEVSEIDSESSLWNRRATALDGTTMAGTGQPFGDLYAAWDRNSLYLILYMSEYADEHVYVEGRINPSDAVQWDIHGGEKPIRVRISSTGQPSVEGAGAAAEMRQKSTRFKVVLKIPATYFGKQSLAAGDAMPLAVDLSSFGRLYRMHWERTVSLESSRLTD